MSGVGVRGTPRVHVPVGTQLPGRGNGQLDVDELIHLFVPERNKIGKQTRKGSLRLGLGKECLHLGRQLVP